MAQKSYDNSPTLYLIPTPIGNLEDMTYRAIKTMQEVDFLYCEDTRVTKKLCIYFEIETPLRSSHMHNEFQKKEEIIELLELGHNIGIVSDAGTPVISDPGFVLSEEVIKKGFNVVALPGANAFVPALLMSGIKPQPFQFYGFLEHKESKKRKELETLKDNKETIIFYESPHRIEKTLLLINEVLGNREIAIAREISKLHEEVIRGTVLEVLDELNVIKGEFVLILSGAKEVEYEVSNIPLNQQVDTLIDEGMPKKDAIKEIARRNNLKKNEVYNNYHN